MRRLAITALLYLAAAPALAQPAIPAHVVAQTFCMARVTGDMSLVEPYFTPELSHAIESAMAQNAAIQMQHPDEKPPLGDGVPWASYPDVPDECAVDYDAAGATPAEVPVTYGFPDSPAANWTDRLVLREVSGEWKLDDVIYQDGRRLTETLVTVFEP